MTKRPQIRDFMTVTTPRAVTMMALLGPGYTFKSVTLTRSEWEDVRKLYGFVPEKPNKKPAAPKLPDLSKMDEDQRQIAEEKHERVLEAHAAWEDPQPLMQAGADRNAIRFAESDGLRLLAWLARFVPVGEDPLRTLIQFASEAGCDVDPNDYEWAVPESSSDECHE